MVKYHNSREHKENQAQKKEILKIKLKALINHSKMITFQDNQNPNLFNLSYYSLIYIIEQNEQTEFLASEGGLTPTEG